MSTRSRTKMALSNGVDLVLQIPTYAAVGSAEIFAATATRILDATGICEYLAFGSEQDRLPELKQIADILTFQENEMWSYLEQALKQGNSYSAAREQFVAEKTNSATAALLQKSNQILAIEYLKAINKYNLNLKPWLIQRQGSSYLSDTPLNSSDTPAPEFASSSIDQTLNSDHYASALAIRMQIENCLEKPGFPANLIESLEAYISKSAFSILLTELAQHKGSTLQKLSDLLYYLLESTDIPTTRYMNEALLNRLQNVVRYSKDHYLSIETLVEKTMTKQLPSTRVKRALTNLLLKIEEKPNFDPSYIQVLGFNKQGRYLLKRMSKTSKLPIISNFSELQAILSKDSSWQEKLELRAARIWLQNNRRSLNEIFESPVII